MNTFLTVVCSFDEVYSKNWDPPMQLMHHPEMLLYFSLSFQDGEHLTKEKNGKNGQKARNRGRSRGQKYQGMNGQGI